MTNKTIATAYVVTLSVATVGAFFHDTRTGMCMTLVWFLLVGIPAYQGFRDGWRKAIAECIAREARNANH